MDVENRPEIPEWETEPVYSSLWDVNSWDVNPRDASPRDASPRDASPRDASPRESSFEFVLDNACERLREKQVQFSIMRIHEMEARLDLLEKELNEILGKRP